jgi:hypothetical protein
MAMTREQKTQQAHQIAQWVFSKWKAEGNRFYRYKTHYYLRTSYETGWLVDFEKRDDIIEEIWNSGGLRHPSCQFKKMLVDALLMHVQPVAMPVDTTGFKLKDFVDPLLSETERLESFVNACDERNTLQTKG